MNQMDLDFGSLETLFKILAQFPEMYDRKKLNWIIEPEREPRIAVGSVKVSSHCLWTHKITHVISACGSDSHLDSNRFKLFTNWTPDDGVDKPKEYWQRSIDFALEALEDSNTRLYVHCLQGINRGPAHAYAILRSLGYEINDSWHMIKEARGKAMPRYVINIERVMEWTDPSSHARNDVTGNLILPDAH